MSRVKHFPTKLIKEILDDAPYYRTSTGRDYFDYAEDLKEEYFNRMNKKTEKDSAKLSKEAPKKLITIGWEIRNDEETNEEYAYLEATDFPFYSAHVYFVENYYIVIVNNGYRNSKAEMFETIQNAFRYAKAEFKKLTKEKNIYNDEYKVKVTNPRSKHD